MNRNNLYSYIEEKIHILAHRITTGGKLNILSLHLHSESFYQHLFNLLYGYNLVNLNNKKTHNVEAIDLIDEEKEIVIQVSSVSTKVKIEGALKKDSIKDYAHYTFKFISIAKDASALRKNTYKNPHVISFDPSKDISDITSILSEIFSLDIDKLESVYEFIQKELGDTSYKVQKNLTVKTSTYDSNFIGRKDEIRAIDEMLESSTSLLLINGIGGMGKSSLANYYLNARESKFDHYGFIEGLDSFVSEFRDLLQLKAQKEEELYYEIISKLQGLKGKKLLVIDNVEDMENNKKLIEMILSLHKYDYKILFTSRRKIKNVKEYPLGTLLHSDAQTLFLSYFKTDESEKVDAIITYLGLHTLFIKLVAETIENEGYSLDDILKKFENGELSKIEFIDEESGEELTLNQNLQELFSMQNLNDEYILLLKRLTVLPSIDIELSFLEEILGKERLKGRLNFLVGRGWLIENDGSYKLHQIIKEFLLANYAPCFEDIEGIVNFFNQFLENSVDIHVAIKYREHLTYLFSLTQALKTMKIINEKVATLFQHTSNIYRNLGMYKESFPLIKNSIKMYVTLFGNEHISTASSYNNLGLLYFTIGNNEEAKKLYIKSLKLTEKVTNKKDMYIASIYNNLGDVYKALGLYTKSEEYFLKALELYEELLSIDDINRATIYNNLGEVYREKAQYEIAHDYYIKSLKINESIFETYHPNIALTYNNLGLLYNAMGNEKDAKKSYDKAIFINNKIWGEEHSNVAMTYNNLAIYYHGKGVYDKAEELYLKALSINKRILGNEHTFTLMNIVNLAELYRWKKLYVKAKPLYFEALDLYKKIYGEAHPAIATTYNNLGGFYFNLKDFNRAYEYMQNAYIMRKKFLVKNHPLLLQTADSLKVIKRALNTKMLITSNQKITRNSSCPCNSGKKYKKCCGK